jgi:hypothetical protein
MSSAALEVIGPDCPDSPGFFDGDDQPRPEIVEGIIREGQLGAFAGAYGMAKSPIATDLTLHVIRGMRWCGRHVSQRRPVIAFDFETPAATYRGNIKSAAKHLGVEVPIVPDELDVYLEHDNSNAPATKKLLAAIAGKTDSRMVLIDEALTNKPNALVIVDPLELMFRVDTLKKIEILRLYEGLRKLLAKYPHAAIIMTFNLRKKDKRAWQSSLLLDPRGWLEEVCGSLDILNRSDVRLGVDVQDGGNRVLNGIRRGEDMHPLIIRSVELSPETYAGFELCPPDAETTSLLFSPKQREYWDKLPKEFRFEEVADSLVPRSTLHRILKRAKSAGLVESDDALWTKASVPG